MSINKSIEMKCPKCGQIQKITVWNSITVFDSLDLKNDLLLGKVNKFLCSSCSYVALMPTPLLYHDDEKKLMISFIPSTDEEAITNFKQTRETSKKSGELDKLVEYNLRFVNEYNSLLEKILIFDANLNDKAIEVIKLMILSQEQEKAGNRICMFGKFENDKIEFMVSDTVEQKIYTSSVPLQTYDIIWKQLRESGVKPYSFDWEQVNKEYAGALLKGINNAY